MTKVLFVEPRGPKSNVFSKYMTIPLLGPVYLATIAKQAGYDAFVINENIIKRDIRSDELESVDILCLSCLTTTVTRGKEIAKKYKLLNPNGKTIIGGIHASMLPDDVVNNFDQVIVGEAESAILDILSGRIKDKIVRVQRPTDLDSLITPNLKLIKNWESIKRWPVMTSRGCPFDCNFCSVTAMFGKAYRSQSPEKVMAVTEHTSSYMKGNVFFVDDNFTANMERSDKIFDLLIKSDLDRSWSTQVRTEITRKPEFIAKMKKAGCDATYIGFESINPDSLKSMKKAQTVEDIKRSIKVFHDNGIMVHGMFIFGTDSDTKETFRQTSDFCKDTGIDFVQYSVMTPLPGSQIYHDYEQQGRLLHKDWEFYDGLHAVFKPKNMTAYELQQGMIDCFSDFYTYTNGINDAINASFDTAITSIRKTYSNAHFPSFYPTFMKFAGRKIVKNWIAQNKHYLERLSQIKTQWNAI